jgi:hypothetical protein
LRHSQVGKRSQKLKCGLLLSDDGRHIYLQN